MEIISNALWTVDNLCEYLRISKTTAYRLLQSGQIQSIRFQRRWMIPEQAMKDYIQKCSTPSMSQP